MESHLRLAERRGIFHRPDLSPIQSACLELALVVEERQRMEEKSFRLRLALAGADPAKIDPDRVKGMFPDLFGTREELTDEDISDEEFYNSPGTWEFTEQIDPATAEELMKQLMQEESVGTLTPGDVENEWI